MSIAGPAGALEVALNVPDQAPRGIALVAHPHPLQGGTLDNKVVQTLAKTFVALGYVAVRFNFRGVGQAAGAFDEGIGETDDALAALAYARDRVSATRAGRARRILVRLLRADARRAASDRASAWCWSAPAVDRFPRRQQCRPTRSSSTARRTTSCRSPTCSPGRVRSSCRSSCFPAAGISSTAGCRSCRASSPACGGDRGERAERPPARSGQAATMSCSPWRGLRKSLRRQRSRARPDLRDPSRRMLRPARPERRRQDDDAALLPRPDRSRRRHDQLVGEPVPKAAREARIRVGVVPQMDNLDPDFTVRENLLIYGRYFGIAARDARRAHSAAARIRRTRRARARRQHPHAVGRHEAAADAGARADQRSRAADPRRADHRPRSAGAAPDLGRPAPAADAGQDHPADHALHGRGRAPVRRGSRSSTTAR